MFNTLKNATLLLILGIFTLGVGCASDGPLENAGESIDEAATDMGNAVEDACENATDEDC